MTLLNNQQKQLLFDYCIGLTSEEEAAKAEALISSNKEAAKIHSKLKAALAPLDSLEPQACPDDLVEGTIWRLNNFARSSQLRLQQLLATEQAKKVTAKSRFWRNLGEMAATAAAILIVAGVFIPPLNFARQKSWQARCGVQMGSIFRGLNNYISDYDGRLPAVATTTGSSWWKVACQGEENCSNTRPPWLMVKLRYVAPADFVCPGRSQGRALQFDPSKVKNCNDFPARRYITYSFPIRCPQPTKRYKLLPKVLMADLNTLFERLPRDYSNPLKLQLDKELSSRNSINHGRRGQNILISDGGVKFLKVRYIGIEQDDIYTLQGVLIYQGIEVPLHEADIFVAP
ncbi:MAG: hypothetical protein ACYS6W_04245 [Planctomycetota bacterium]|jgi:hypothetical protein